MKKLILFFVIFVLIGISSVQAYDEWPIKTKVITANEADISALDAGTLIFAIKVIAKGAANGQFELYDTTTLSAATHTGTNPIDEITQATQGQTSYSPLPQPYRVVNGTTALIYNSAVGIVYYRD